MSNKRKEHSTFDPKIHFKSKGGSGYQMKKSKLDKTKQVKISGKPTRDGLEIAKVFGWKIDNKNYGRHNSRIK